jgi:hypothetical protein
MKYCSQCGYKVKDNIEMCEKCDSLLFQENKPVFSYAGNSLKEENLIEGFRVSELRSMFYKDNILFILAKDGICLKNDALHGIGNSIFDIISIPNNLLGKFIPWDSIKVFKVDTKKKMVKIGIILIDGTFIKLKVEIKDKMILDYLLPKQINPEQIEFKNNKKPIIVMLIIMFISIIWCIFFAPKLFH